VGKEERRSRIGEEMRKGETKMGFERRQGRKKRREKGREKWGKGLVRAICVCNII